MKKSILLLVRLAFVCAICSMLWMCCPRKRGEGLRYDIYVTNQTNIPLDTVSYNIYYYPWLESYPIKPSDQVTCVANDLPGIYTQLKAGHRVWIDTMINYMDVFVAWEDSKVVKVDLIVQPDTTLRIEQKLMN